ncbi:MAG: FliA/WhiG family RNA polymerase sigma factor [Clostridiaceae bacterium]|nr:FliA/WhiG family RNA polymerase sigma factor [Clostridiaceae bacterium]
MVAEYRREQADSISVSTWERYEKSHDLGLRNKILMAYLYIATCSVKKMYALAENRQDIEDMTSQCVLELINCIDRYDWRRGVQFDSFASIRVRGAIIDYIRKKDWVPRDIRKRTNQMNSEYQALQNELGRSPEDGELAQRLGMTVEEVEKLRREELSFNVLAFEELLLENGPSILGKVEQCREKSPECVLLKGELGQKLAEFIDELSEKERTVISLYYYEELKLKEIAFVMGVTVSRVSQIHSRALSKLKAHVEEYIEI